MSLLAELKRRNVIRAAGLYLVGAWLLVQIAGTILPMFGAPDWIARSLVILLAISFVPALVFAWVFELTPSGLKRDEDVPLEQSIAPHTGRRMDRAIIVVLACALAYFAVDKFVLTPRREAALAPTRSLPATVANNSIAVMPFADLSAAQDQALFSEGMAEEILNALTRIKSLRVLGRSSSFQFEGKNIAPQSIGEQLGVAHVLSGSVRKQGNELRITVELVRTSDGVQQWSNQYDGSLADVFKLQDACARDVASELDITLSDAGARRLVDKVTDNPQAYAKFIEAQELVTHRSGDSLPRAIVLLDEATNLDPNFARAWAELAVAHAVVVQYAGGDWTLNWQAALTAAKRAIALDPDIAEAHAVIGYVNLSRRRYLDMVIPARRSLELDPDDITANFWMSNQLASMGRIRDAETFAAHALQRDPANPLVNFYEGSLLWMMGKHDQSMIFVRRASALGMLHGGTVLGYDAVQRGDIAAGARFYAQGMAAIGTRIPLQDIETIFTGAYESGAAHAKAIAVLDRYPDDEYTPTLLILLGAPGRSFALFERSQSGLSDAYFTWLWMKDEAWSRKARQSPAFQLFAKRMGMVDYWKRYGWPDLCQPAPDVGADAFTCQ